MEGPARITAPLLDVLEVLIDAFEDGSELHGWAIMKAIKRSGPTVYGVVDRLEEAGWIIGRWESENPEPNKPRRRLYRLTPNGVAEARALLSARRPQASRGRRPPEPGLARGLTILCRPLRVPFRGAR
jgi:DNA-binding PadR family transcriptional regulator